MALTGCSSRGSSGTGLLRLAGIEALVVHAAGYSNGRNSNEGGVLFHGFKGDLLDNWFGTDNLFHDSFGIEKGFAGTGGRRVGNVLGRTAARRTDAGLAEDASFD